MILIGQYDSPFVRRVGIALTLYGLPFRHEPWSVFGDAQKIARHNPLIRVPTLVLDDGDVLIESHSILDHLDSLVPAAQRLFPVAEPQRRKALKLAALATGVAEKAVSLFYEKRLHAAVSDVWVSRCNAQIAAGVAELEAQVAARGAGTDFGHAEIAVAVMLRFVSEAHPGLVDLAACPALSALSRRLEALPVFRSISQSFIPPA